VVIGLQTTGEAAMARKMLQGGDVTWLSSARESMIALIQDHFPMYDVCVHACVCVRMCVCVCVCECVTHPIFFWSANTQLHSHYIYLYFHTTYTVIYVLVTSANTHLHLQHGGCRKGQGQGGDGG
jgi:hypothetical protein